MPYQSQTMRIRALLVVAVLLATGCGSQDSPGASGPRTVFGGDRPVTLQIPPAYDGTTPAPLLILLHGYGASGGLEEVYLGLSELVASNHTFLAAPTGLIDSKGHAFWNATDACCNFDGNPVDDVAYLRGLIRDISHDYRIDPKRVYLWGHSNGAFMAHRMACDDAPEIAAIVSLAGATWNDPTKCTPSAQVSVLDIHGDSDDTIHYGGGETAPGLVYPSEATTMQRWQGYDACTPGLADDPTPIDIESAILGPETTVSSFAGCPVSGVELWTILGGTHIPNFQPDFRLRVWNWLQAHPRG